MIWELVATALCGGVFGAGVTIFLASRSSPGFRDLDAAEDFVNLLDDASFKRLFTATLIRDRRRGHASGKA
jgi:hypothetical protein